MAALGLAVAVPAVLGYNWVMRRNKAIAEQLGAFSSDLYGYMMSGGAVRPVSVGKPAAAAPKTPAATAPPSPRACLSEWTREPSWSARPGIRPYECWITRRQGKSRNLKPWPREVDSGEGEENS